MIICDRHHISGAFVPATETVEFRKWSESYALCHECADDIKKQLLTPPVETARGNGGTEPQRRRVKAVKPEMETVTTENIKG
jgi:hypothetical protein